MPEAREPQRNREKHFVVPSIMTLAFWRLYRTWFLLSIIMIGMIAAVVIVCAAPLFSDVMTTAGLRNTLRAGPTSSEIAIDSTTQGISTQLIHDVHSQLATLFHQNLPSLISPSQYLFQSSDFAFSPASNRQALNMYATSMQQVAPYLGHIQGRLPGTTSNAGNEIEVMLTSASAQQLQVQVGSQLHLAWNYFTGPEGGRGSFRSLQTVPITADVVGIFDISSANLPYWHGEDFNPLNLNGRTTQDTYKFLLSDTAMLALADKLSAPSHADAVYSTMGGYALHWYYRLDVSHITINDLPTLMTQLAALQTAFSAQYNDLSIGDFAPPVYPYLTQAKLSGQVISSSFSSSSLDRFSSRYDVSRIPVIILTIQIVALIFFFVSLMTNLLVDRQSETLALLRSRGASSGQVFWALLVQGGLLGVISIVIGVPLTVLIVSGLARAILPAAQQDALVMITSNVFSTMLNLLVYAVAVAFIMLLAMSVSLFLIARMDLLAMRREQGRFQKRPLWQRLNLDVIAGAIALVGYAISLYLTSLSTVLQGDAKTLITTPLSIIAPFFLVIGCMLLFMRIFPLLLRLASHIAARGRGAVSMLAFAQVARSPRQSMRMLLLLTLSISFTLFTLVYMATQSGHIQQIATYQTGADFGGDLPTGSTARDPNALIQKYHALQGVISASPGFIGQGTAGNAGLSIALRAVDPTTFLNTVLWATDKDRQAADLYLNDLITKRPKAAQTNLIPAIVDTSTLQTLRLHLGSFFKLKVDGTSVDTVQCFVSGTVTHIPTVNDQTTPGGATQGFAQVGGVLIDYQTYNTVYQHLTPQSSTSGFGQSSPPPALNHVWLHTQTDAVSLASIRTALNRPAFLLINIADGPALLADLHADPPYLVLSGVLEIGTITALMLAVLGNLLTSWLTARTRLANFAVLRALGTSRSQVARILIWEQANVYVFGLLLGIAFGAFLSATVIPSLTFSNINTDLNSTQFFNLQTVFPTQIIIPPTLPLALIVLATIYIGALLMMIRVISRPSLVKTLRLDEG